MAINPYINCVILNRPKILDSSKINVYVKTPNPRRTLRMTNTRNPYGLRSSRTDRWKVQKMYVTASTENLQRRGWSVPEVPSQPRGELCPREPQVLGFWLKTES